MKLELDEKTEEYAKREWAITYYERIFRRLVTTMQRLENAAGEAFTFLKEVAGMSHILELFEEDELADKDALYARRNHVLAAEFRDDVDFDHKWSKLVDEIKDIWPEIYGRYAMWLLDPRRVEK